MTEKAIACVEVPHTATLHCPFCGQEVMNPQKAHEGEEYYSACPHTLFVAHDEAFEYRSARFDSALGIAGAENDDLDLPEHGIDGLTSQVKMHGAVKFAGYVPAPSFFGTYVGFAPEE
ncbi:hypothetical protein [Shimia biformata]|uniref:hypothetical protein n=1 Tax=Shimia biformata TaxID=1294299 RepID=UPI0019513680|nr:hypothetical protein [Shimia biformata]